MFAGLLVMTGYRCLFGMLAQRISALRGKEGGFWWGFWLGVIGLMVVAFRKPDTEAVQVSASPATRWMCLSCGAKNPAGAEKCLSCMADRNARPRKKACPACGAVNNKNNQNCFACGGALL